MAFLLANLTWQMAWSEPHDDTTLNVIAGFEVQSVYKVPRAEQGSWVSLAVDPRGDLIASDQEGSLYRIHRLAPPSENDPGPPKVQVERLPVSLGMAQGLAFVANDLYVVVNGEGVDGRGSGLYVLPDKEGDGTFDPPVLIQSLDGFGEHGPHAVVPTGDGRTLYIVAGNHTALPPIFRSRVPRVWDEDQIVDRLWDPGGHAVGIMAPGGWICRVDPRKNRWELISIGLRNAYDVAQHASGEWLTYDSDMEWDLGLPWYRPTRLLHVTSGSEFGWRSGSGKWPTWYPDSLPATLELGPGSPTGLVFGYDTRFPERYRHALYACDWSFGRIYAIHLAPSGSTFQAEAEEFLTGVPLAVTDIVAHPKEGSLYFLTGGRNSPSALYRVVYRGGLAAPATPEAPAAPAVRFGTVVPRLLPDEEFSRSPEMALRHRLESQHVALSGNRGAAKQGSQDAIDEVWRALEHEDRFLRFAARTALEHRPFSDWEARLWAERTPRVLIEAAIAAIRVQPKKPGGEQAELAEHLLEQSHRLEWASLPVPEKLGLLRVWELIRIRLPPPPSASIEMLATTLLAGLDDPHPDVRIASARGLSRLERREVLTSSLDRMEQALTQEEQIAYAYALRAVIPRATRDEQEAYFRWFFEHGTQLYGGASLQGFLLAIREDAANRLSQDQRKTLADWIDRPMPQAAPPTVVTSGPVVEEYTQAEVLTIVQSDAPRGTWDEARQAFSKAQCFKCHRVGSEGGATGPDLTTATRRFSIPYLVESLMDPDRAVSDRYQTSTFVLTNGKVITGRVANLSQDFILVVTDLQRPGDFERVQRADIEEIARANKSEMPTGLLNVLTPAEIRALFAYLESAGNSNAPAFRDESTSTNEPVRRAADENRP